MSKPLLFAGIGAAALGALALGTRGSIPPAQRSLFEREAQKISERARRAGSGKATGRVSDVAVSYARGEGYRVAGGAPLDSPHAVALTVWKRLQQAGAQANYEEEWEARDRKVRELARKLGLPSVGLNADWSVSAWHAGPSDAPNMTGGDVYILEDEEAYEPTYIVARRWYVDDGYETGQQYRGLPGKYRDSADGHNDAIVELRTFPSFAKAARFAMKLAERLRRG